MLEFWLQTATGTFQFKATEVTIGRDRRCSFVLPDASVMPLHARLVVEEGRLYLEKSELDALTFLNRAPIHRRAEVYNGDIIDIGPYTLILQSRHLERRLGVPSIIDDTNATPSDATIMRRIRLPDTRSNFPSDDTSSDFFII